ncbi:MAG: LuxR C-terminal-related transcriptional regulator, partial [Planctomycetota bacterium]
ATIEHASIVVNRGAAGFIALPASRDRVKRHLGEVNRRALQTCRPRRAAAKHRRALAKLTDGERDVLDRLLRGFANKQIAQRLSIGLRTVELRRSKIMRKMDATSLAQLISHVCQADAGLCAATVGGDRAGG